jgi:hypothetical protein
MQAWESRCSVTSPSVLGKVKACSSGLRTELLSKQSLPGQVSAKLTPKICINNAASNSRLTAAGRQATAADSHSQTCLQTLCFLSPYLWWENNWTTPACWKIYWNCIAFELGTLCGFFFFLVLCGFVLFYVTPLMNNYRTSEAPSPGLEAEGRTPKLLRLKLHCIWTWRFFSFLSLFFLFFIFNLLSVSLMPFQLTVD